MNGLFAIIPVAILAIVAAANRASSEKPAVSADYSAVFSKDNEQKTEKRVVSDAAGGYCVDNDGDGICDNYADGSCPAIGTGSGYHHGNGNGTGRGCHHGNGHCHG